METLETAGLNESRITPEAQQFATRLFTRLPELRRYAAMQRTPGNETWTLVVTVPAPSEDPETQLVIWLDDGVDPSVGFGMWHTHENLIADADEEPPHKMILDIIDGILADRFIICEDVGRAEGLSATILDLSIKDALLEYLTSKHSSGKSRLRSWSGRLDRTVDLDDLDREDSAYEAPNRQER